MQELGPCFPQPDDFSRQSPKACPEEMHDRRVGTSSPDLRGKMLCVLFLSAEGDFVLCPNSLKLFHAAGQKGHSQDVEYVDLIANHPIKFSILNSQILNSQFSILNSQFSILNSQFSHSLWSCLFTSESVTEGHPDKSATRFPCRARLRIAERPESACCLRECLANTGLVLVAGEIRQQRATSCSPKSHATR